MDNTDNPPDPDVERVQGSPDNGQPPNPSSSRIQTHVHSGIVNSLVDLREAVLRLGVELTALSNELGEDRSDFLERINPDLTNESGIEEPQSTTDRIHDFRRDIHGQVAQLSETARFWLEQDPEETAFMPPEVPPGSPEPALEELGGPSFVPPRPPLVDAPRLLLGGSYHRPPLSELAHLNSSNLLHAHTPHEHNAIPQLLSASESSDDDEVDLNEYRARFQAAGGSTRNSPEDSTNDYGMPGLMYVSESSDDEGGPADGENSSDDSGRDEEGAPEESARPVRNELLYVRLDPPRISYTRDPWVIPGSGMHQLLMQGRAPDDPTPPSLIGPEAGQPPQSLETREPHTGDAAWQTSRMQKLLSSLEVLDESMLDRFCRVGGGGGEHNDQCMICWESLKVEPTGDRSWTAIENTLSEENVHASTPAGNLIATPETSTSLTMPWDDSGAAALPCLHVFHFKCLVPWFDKLATTCPVCRFDLDPHKLLLFPVSALSRLAGRHVLTREWTSEDPLFQQAVVAQEESRGRIERSPPYRGAQSSQTTSPMQSIGGDDGSWSLTELSTEDSIPSLHSIPAQQTDQDIAEDTTSEHSSGDSMPPLSEPLANGASDLAELIPPTVETLATITIGPASNGASGLSNPRGINHDSSGEEHPTAPPTSANNTGTRESTVLEEVDAEDPVHSASDISTDVDSMPSLIAASGELGPLFSSPNMGRNSRAAREESRGDSEMADQDGERHQNRFTAAQAASTTDNPQEASFRDYAAETRTFLSEMQDTLLNAYVRFSNIRAETATDLDVLQAQANRWASLTSNREVASMPPPLTTSGIPTTVPVIIPTYNRPLWMSSQDTARREWVLPKGPVEGGVANWINKREAEIRGDLKSRPS